MTWNVKGSRVSQFVMELSFCIYCILGYVMFPKTSASSLVQRNAFGKTMEFKTEDWGRVPQSVHNVLTSINEKLRNLDTMELKLDYSLMQMTRRLENMELKIGRLETKFDVRMESFDISNGRDVKDFSNEHLFRRIETLNEKINDKAAYLDVKLDSKLERITNKLDRLDRTFHNSMNDIVDRFIKSNDRLSTIENEMSKENDKIVARYREFRALLNEDVNGLLVTKSNELKSQFHELYSKFYDRNEEILATCRDFNDSIINHLLDPKSQTDDMIDNVGRRQKSSVDFSSLIFPKIMNNLTHSFEMYQKINDEKFEELSSDLMLSSRKIVNVIQESQKITDHLKLNLSSIVILQNEVREYMRLEFTRLREQTESVPRLARKFSFLNEHLNEKFQKLEEVIDSNLKSIFLTQNEFRRDCHRIQENEVQAYDIMQQIVGEMLNRSADDIFEIYSRLGEQSIMLNTSLAHLMIALLNVGNVTTRAIEKIAHDIKHKDQCIFWAEDISWNTVDSLCQRVSMEIPSSAVELVDLVRSVAVMEHNLTLGWDNLQPVQASDMDDGIVSVKDYDVDYPASDYVEPLSD